jgi:hypothetical protein
LDKKPERRRKHLRCNDFDETVMRDRGTRPPPQEQPTVLAHQIE